MFRWLVPSKGKMLFGYQRCATGKAPTQPLCEGFRFMSLRNYAGRRGHSVYKTWRRGRESGGRSGVRVLLFPGSTTKRAPTWRYQRAAASKSVLPFIVYYTRLLPYSLPLSLSPSVSVSIFSHSFTIFVMAREHAYLRTLATGISEEFRTRNFYPSVLTVSRTRHVYTAAPRFVSIARVPRSNGEKALTVVVQRKTALPRSQHVESERKRVFRPPVFAAARICVPRWTRFSCRREFFFLPFPSLSLSLYFVRSPVRSVCRSSALIALKNVGRARQPSPVEMSRWFFLYPTLSPPVPLVMAE